MLNGVIVYTNKGKNKSEISVSRWLKEIRKQK